MRYQNLEVSGRMSRIDEVGKETRGVDDKPSRIGNLGECEG